MISKNPRHKVGGRLDVTFTGEVCEIAESQTNNLTDKFNSALKQSKIVFKYPREDGWRIIEN